MATEQTTNAPTNVETSQTTLMIHTKYQKDHRHKLFSVFVQ